MIRICHLYYVDGLTQQEIADKYRLSRVTIARILKEAANQKVVTFNIAHPTSFDENLAVLLERRLGIDRVLVVSRNERDTLTELLGIGGARLLSDILRDNDVIGLSSGVSVSAVAECFAMNRAVKNITVVQLVGSFSSRDDSGSAAVAARTLASKLNGEIALLNAPAVVDKPDLRSALLGDSSITPTLELFSRVNVAVFGIGSLTPSPSSHLVRAGYLGVEEVQKLVNLGAVGDILTCFLLENGTIHPGPLRDRVIALEAEALRDIPFTIAVAGGAHKAKAIQSAVRAGLVRMLVTDQSLAEAILGDSSA
jgi:deoxyribonucleoside regulator